MERHNHEHLENGDVQQSDQHYPFGRLGVQGAESGLPAQGSTLDPWQGTLPLPYIGNVVWMVLQLSLVNVIWLATEAPAYAVQGGCTSSWHNRQTASCIRLRRPALMLTIATPLSLCHLQMLKQQTPTTNSARCVLDNPLQDENTCNYYVMTSLRVPRLAQGLPAEPSAYIARSNAGHGACGSKCTCDGDE